jgi:hypothetical protein
VLTSDDAIALAARHQRQALRDVAAFADALGEPVGFLHRRRATGTEFEAVALDSARTCAVVGADGTLRYVAGGVPRDPSRPVGRRAPARGPHTGVRRVAERALAATARPR